MFKSIFSKQVAVYAAALILGFGLMGFALSNMFSSYFVQQKTESMTAQGERIARSLAQYDYFRTPSSASQFQEDVKMLSSLGLSCIFVNADGLVVGYTSDIPNVELSQELTDEAALGALKVGRVIVQGNLGGVYDESVLTVGCPIAVNNTLWGAIFISAPLTEVHATVSDVVKLTVGCLVVSLAISLGLIYVSSRTISKPLRNITEAAKVIAAGNFEKRLEVKTRDEVGQLAESFNNMTESLENIEKNRVEFIANISHDLRSPLTSMQGFLQAVLDGTVPPESQDKYLNIVLDESRRLSKLANDILALSNLQNPSAGLNLTVFDINELIREDVLKFEGRATAKELSVDISFADERDMVVADREKIERVVHNLIDNAVKFSDPGGQIRIRTWGEKGKVLVSVADDGRGLSPADQKKVFDRFYKADASRGEDKKGSGLGLSIVKEFIKAHGESITLTSEPGKGCEFAFSLKAAHPGGDA